MDILTEIRNADSSQRNLIFKELYEKLHDYVVYGLVKKNCDYHKAEDFFQEAYVVFLSKIDDTDFELTCNIKTYFYSVAYKKFLQDLARKEQYPGLFEKENHQPKQAENSVFWKGQLLSTDIHHIEIKETFNEALASLFALEPFKKCRNILDLYYFENMTHTSIAEKLGYSSENTAKVMKGKCLKKIKAFVAKDAATFLILNQEIQ